MESDGDREPTLEAEVNALESKTRACPSLLGRQVLTGERSTNLV